MLGDCDDSIVDMLYAFTEEEDAMEAARGAAERRNESYWGRFYAMKVEERSNGYVQRGETCNYFFQVRAVDVKVGIIGSVDTAYASPVGDWLWAIHVNKGSQPCGLEAFFCSNKAGKEQAVKRLNELVEELRSSGPDTGENEGDLLEAIHVDPTNGKIKSEVHLVTKLNPDFEDYFDDMDNDEVRDYVRDWHPNIEYTIQLIHIPIEHGPLPESPFMKYSDPLLPESPLGDPVVELWSKDLKDEEAEYEIEERCSVYDKSDLLASLEQYIITSNRDVESESESDS
jgi:hypothetical protein